MYRSTPWFHSRVNMLSPLGTTPAARKRGLAELCTRAATNRGFDLGARVAALQASVMGEPIYARMGYVTVTRYPTFVQLEPPRR